MFGLQGWHLLIVIAVILLLFGASRLPNLARSVGQSMKIFRNEIKSEDGKPGDAKSDEPGSADAPGSAGDQTK